MAQDEATTTGAAGVTERLEGATPAGIEPSKSGKRRKKSKAEEDFGYDVDFETPFGKIEFAMEPASVKEQKDQERRENAEREAAKAAAKAAKQAEKRLKQGAPERVVVRGGGGKLVPILLIFLLVAGAVALAIWLFARPGEEEPDVVPAEFRNDDLGRQASREAQAEQERKFQDLTGKK